MIKLHHAVLAAASLAALSLSSPAEAACFKKAASGTGASISDAKFQVYEALLQSFDWGVWATYMATGSTPGYRISPSYSCSKGGLGYNCKGVATICKG